MFARRIPHSFALILVAAAVAACSDEAVGPSAQRPLRILQQPPGTTASANLRALQRFSVALRIVGEPSLTRPTQFAVRVRAHLPTQRARISVVAPELELALGTLQAERPGAVTLTPVLQETRSFVSGGELELMGSVNITQPGYYNVIAYANGAGDPLGRNISARVQDVARAQLWVFVDENGWRVTPGFDETAFPDSVVRGSGPRLLPGQRPARRDDVAKCCNDGFQGWVKYTNQKGGGITSLDPIANAQVEVRFYTGANPGYPESYFDRFYPTDANGYFRMDCVTGYNIAAHVRLTGPHHTVRRDPDNTAPFSGSPVIQPFGVEDACSGSAVITVESEAGQVFTNMAGSIVGFGKYIGSMPTAHVYVVPSSVGSKYLGGGSSTILIDADAIVGEWGKFVAGHEYGHLYHREHLGVTSPGNCPSPHFLTGAHNLSCAYTEGIANFFGTYATQDSLHDNAATGMENRIETPHNESAFALVPPGKWCLNQVVVDQCPSLSIDGHINETAVGAFLYDIADGPSTANPSIGEDDDGQSLGGAFVANIIAACDVLQNGTWIKNNGADHLIYCFEARMGGYAAAGFFPTRSPHPTDFNTNGTLFHISWNKEIIKQIWQSNLYYHGVPGGGGGGGGFTATINGESNSKPGRNCLFTVSGNLPPDPTYEWRVNWGGVVETSSQFYYWTQSEGYVTISVTVRNGSDPNQIAEDDHQLQISWSGSECNAA